MNEKFSLTTDIIKLNGSVNTENGCAVAVGGFDGVHLGHRKLIDSLVAEARVNNLPAAVFTFSPYDNPKDSKLLALPEKRLELLKSLGVDIVAEASFTALRDVSAEEFAKGFLFEGMGAKTIVCGYDFRFGKGREGDVALISGLLSPHGVSVVTPSALLTRDVPVSSTAIRKHIAEGDVKTANLLLGRKFSFKAEVVHGAKLGRTLGFPTINQVYPTSLSLLKFGVYAVECNFGGKTFFGVANVGVKPTVAADSAPLCETFIFDYSGDCYGETVETSFVEFIRPEIRFPSVDELRSQIERDKAFALGIFSKGV